MVQIEVDGAILCTLALLVNRTRAIFTLKLIFWPIISSDPISISFQKLDNMTSRPPVSGSGTASVNSSQRQTMAR